MVCAKMTARKVRPHWVETLGGPHLVLPEAHADAWEGNAAPSKGRVIQATFRCDPSSPATDYDRACSIDDWLGVIPVGDGQALVLSGDDTSAAYFCMGTGKDYLLRWLYAPSETDLLDYFYNVCERLEPEKEDEFQHSGGKIFLMDSVDAVGSWATPPSAFVMPRGRYRVLTSYSESEEVYIIVHKLKRE
jgi:hypothetical protein